MDLWTCTGTTYFVLFVTIWFKRNLFSEVSKHQLDTQMVTSYFFIGPIIILNVCLLIRD